MEKQFKMDTEKKREEWEKVLMLKITDRLAGEQMITPDEKARLVERIRQGGQFGCCGL